jgi:hypothetical protein
MTVEILVEFDRQICRDIQQANFTSHPPIHSQFRPKLSTNPPNLHRLTPKKDNNTTKSAR